jgi:hypothetical protein
MNGRPREEIRENGNALSRNASSDADEEATWSGETKFAPKPSLGPPLELSALKVSEVDDDDDDEDDDDSAATALTVNTGSIEDCISATPWSMTEKKVVQAQEDRPDSDVDKEETDKHDGREMEMKEDATAI